MTSATIMARKLPSTAFKKGFVPWNKGVPMNEETKAKVSLAKMGKPSWNKGMPSPWTSARNKVENRQRKGDKHWNWKGGISPERHLLMGQMEYKQWRSDVFKRDGWTCQTCQSRGIYLEAHHIKPWAKFPDLRYSLDNGVTLCKDCHKLADSKNRQ